MTYVHDHEHNSASFRTNLWDPLLKFCGMKWAHPTDDFWKLSKTLQRIKRLRLPSDPAEFKSHKFLKSIEAHWPNLTEIIRPISEQRDSDLTRREHSLSTFSAFCPGQMQPQRQRQNGMDAIGFAKRQACLEKFPGTIAPFQPGTGRDEFGGAHAVGGRAYESHAVAEFVQDDRQEASMPAMPLLSDFMVMIG